jgi:hypothetical protein
MKKILTLLAMAASLLAVSCVKDNDGDDDDQQEEAKGLDIKIDGNFDDWAALKPDVVVSAKNNPNSPWDAVTEIRCCADKDFVYYYIRYNSSVLKEQMENNESLPIRLNINTDGEFTSGYENYSLDAYDFIVEGALADNGAWTTYSGTLHQRIWLEDQEKDGWKELIPSSGGLVLGKGAGSEYEILLARELFNNAVPAEHKMGDVFYTGIRFYGNGGWGELSNMPNSSVEEGDGNGWAHLLKVTTVK